MAIDGSAGMADPSGPRGMERMVKVAGLAVLAVALIAGRAAAEEQLLFDGKTTAGWEIDGDSAVVDGVLVLGGARPTRARPVGIQGENWELRLEYRTEGPGPINITHKSKDFLSMALSDVALERLSRRDDEWIELVYARRYDRETTGWEMVSKVRAAGEPAFKEHRFVGGGLPRTTALWFEIPAGTKVHVRRASLNAEPVGVGMVWYFLMAAVALVALMALGLLVLHRWRRRPRRVTVEGGG